MKTINNLPLVTGQFQNGVTKFVFFNYQMKTIRAHCFDYINDQILNDINYCE